MPSGTDHDRELAARTGFITIAPAQSPRTPGEIVQALTSAAVPEPKNGHDDERAQVQCRELLCSIAGGAFVTDHSGRITAVNDDCCELLGMSHAEVKLLSAHDLISGADETLMQAVLRILERKPHVRIEANILQKDGTAFPAEIQAGSFKISGKTRAVFVIMRALAQDEASTPKGQGTSASKKVETAATVAGQIAHDFDNLLTPLFAYPELIRRDLPENCRGRDLLNIIEKTAHDMAKITQQLLSLSKRGQHKTVTYDLNEVVRHVADLLRDGALKRNIEISTDLDNSLLPIRGAPEQMLRVVQNLCQNSIDAVDGAGRIAIATKNVYLDRPTGRYEKVGVGEYVELRVSDTGGGIPADIIDKIFDPFFTTRKASKSRGSGLGLSVVRGIVDDHHGAIDVESTVGKGTTFHLYFPIQREEQRLETKSGEPVKGGSVLIVDDDSQQREILAQLFQCHDFKTTCFPSGETAIDHISGCAAPALRGEGRCAANRFPDVVILDVVMDPGMDGKETCKRILEINPKQRIVMVSGYPTADYVGGTYPATSVSYLSKPLTWQTISRELQRAIGTESAAAPPDLAAQGANRILVVDDEEGIRRLFHSILSSAFPSAHVELVGNGMEAVAAFKARHHSVIVLDLKMPVMDGQAAFDEIMSLCLANKWESPKVVFCTGFAPPDATKTVASSGQGHVILGKPVSSDALVAAVRKHLAFPT